MRLITVLCIRRGLHVSTMMHSISSTKGNVLRTSCGKYCHSSIWVLSACSEMDEKGNIQYSAQMN